MGTPKFGGRLPGQVRTSNPTISGDRSIFKESGEPAAPAPVAEVHHPKVRVKRGSKYNTPGTCKITGRYAALDSEGISSKGRQRMNGRIKYQRTKVMLRYFKEMEHIIVAAKDGGAWDPGLQGILFDNDRHVENVLGAYAEALKTASVYVPRAPKV